MVKIYWGSGTLLLLMSYAIGAVHFIEKATEIGVNFQHTDGRSGTYQFTETAGSGLAWLDYDKDGWLDFLAINGIGGQHKLYKNTGKNFQDVSSHVLPKHKVSANHRAMGVCSADVNQDGWVDFLITTVGQDLLYLNDKGQRFEVKPLDEKKQQWWSTSCAFADLDQDGDLDLYVTRYVKYTFNGNKSCQNTGIKGYCNPKAYAGENDGLYLNDGNGQFNEVAKERGVHTMNQDRGFGVIISDYDHDGDADIYVANDGGHNRYYVNNGKGYFTDNGLFLGAAINQNGKAEAGMGVAISDINQDGFQDVAVSHFALETNTLYINHQAQYFIDTTQKFGVSRPSFMNMSWGMAFADVNNDGFDDLLVANGHINDFIPELDSRQSYQQANHLFINDGGERFALARSELAFNVDQHRSSRGLAVADYNNDGRIDFAVNNSNDRLTIYENSQANNNSWLGIDLIGGTKNRQAIGAVVTVSSAQRQQRKEVISGGSFMSQSDLRLLFGLGEYKGGIEVVVQWPDGYRSTHKISQLDKYHIINRMDK